MITVLILSALVLLHEFGHFLIARLFKIKVEEFGIGLPPRALKLFEHHGTVYSLNWLPIGGFVRLAGEESDISLWDKLNPFQRKNLFFGRPAWQRVAVLLAGVTMNLLIGIACFSAVYARLGVPQFGKDQVVVAEVAKGSPADLAGLQQGDVVQKIAGQEVASDKQFIELVNAHKGEAVSLYIAKIQPDGTLGGNLRQVTIVPRVNPPQGEGPMGVSVIEAPQVRYQFVAWYAAPFFGVVEGLKETYGWTVAFISIFAHPAELVANLSGPVKVVQVGNQAVEEGWVTTLRFAGIISLNLAIFNLLPIPALDGGRIFLVGMEKVIGRKRVAKVEGYVNMVGMALLILLLVGITIKDVFFS